MKAKSLRKCQHFDAMIYSDNMKKCCLAILFLIVLVTGTNGGSILVTQAEFEIMLCTLGFRPVDCKYVLDQPMTESSRRIATKEFQAYHGLQETGIFDDATRVKVSEPRCDLPDIIQPDRSGRFETVFTKWTTLGKSFLRWRVEKAEGIYEDTAKQVARDAVKLWQKHIVLPIMESEDDDAEILIQYVISDESGNHGGPSNFGESTLAHAFYPGSHPLHGDIHVDMRKEFSTEDPPPALNFNIRITVTHEWGHALGLKHTSVADAMMYAYTSRGASLLGLHSDDILGIKALYGQCTESPCKNGGTCSDQVADPGYSCACVTPYSGTNCTIAICQTNTCGNGGTCSPASNSVGYTCACTTSYTGDTCQETICFNNPCDNGGTCVLSTTIAAGYTCTCTAQYSGDTCKVSVCSGTPCKNGATCQVNEDNANGYICSCTARYMGATCTVSTGCMGDPCQNGGTCESSSSTTYTCTCPSTYTGATCDQKSKCYTSPCENGGTCNLATNKAGYSCSCTTSYTGDQCGVSVCVNNPPCMNGGTCGLADNNDGYVCTCTAQYTGTTCKRKIKKCKGSKCNAATINSVARLSTNLWMTIVLVFLTIINIKKLTQ